MGIARAQCPAVPPLCEITFTKSEIPYLIHQTRDVLAGNRPACRGSSGLGYPLPVGDEINPLLQSTSGPMCLLGHYACSLMMLSYKPLDTPQV